VFRFAAPHVQCSLVAMCKHAVSSTTKHGAKEPKGLATDFPQPHIINPDSALYQVERTLEACACMHVGTSSSCFQSNKVLSAEDESSKGAVDDPGAQSSPKTLLS
jgi:hypothetical protein